MNSQIGKLSESVAEYNNLEHNVYLPSFLLGEGGLNLLPNFQKGGLDRISILEGCGSFSGGLQFLHKK